MLHKLIDPLKKPLPGWLLRSEHLVKVMLSCWLLMAVAFTGQAQENALAPYLRLAESENPTLKRAYQQYQAALQAIPQAEALPDPQLQAGYFLSPVETRVGPQQFRLSASQSLPWFGTLDAKGRVARLKAKAHQQAYQVTKNDIYWQVKKAWYQLYHLQARMRVTADNVAILESLERLANNKFKSGEASMVDVIRTEMDLAELEDQLARLRDKRAPFRHALAEAVNQPVDALPPMPDTLRLKRLSVPPSNLKDTLEKHNPKLRQLALETRSQSAAEKVAEKHAYPDFKLGMQYINTSERSAEGIPDNGQDAFMPHVSISIPINQQAYQAEQQEAAYQKDAAGQQEKAKRNEFMTRLEEAYETYKDARRRVALYREQVRRAQQALDILMTNYSSGDDFEELLRMQQQRLDYELSLAEARVDQNRSVARLRYLTGQTLNP